MTAGVAVVGMACRYPDASSPHELWENVLAGRRAFREIPPERLRLADYYAADRQAADRIYATTAALLEGYEFDRVAYRVAGSTFRACDPAQWLALDVAADALADAGFPDGADLPRQTTGVLVGNTLTGDYTRSAGLRLRWPYVQRVLTSALESTGWSRKQLDQLLPDIEAQFKAPFPAADGDTLVGGLSNTIAGRICNYFNLGGGGYTVDGACSSSLLSVTTACRELLDGDLDVAIAGGVDLSIDPFELVGFAKAGALAENDMRVYDRTSSGFWPGEGCGMVVLMRAADAEARGLRSYATIRGWGVSSDGSGGMTRPEVEGQLLAVQRAYLRAKVSIASVDYFEGHGTGTEVGDRTELETLLIARRRADARRPAAIGSVKANIGHTKAAAGVAGLIKAVMAVYSQVLPPTTGCPQPHPLLAAQDSTLRTVYRAQPWIGDPPRAAVSSMGFGGINAHVVLDAADAHAETWKAAALPPALQDTELFLFASRSRQGLAEQIRPLVNQVSGLSRAELTDLAVSLQRRVRDHPVRAAIVADTPSSLHRRLILLDQALADHAQRLVDPDAGVFLGTGESRPEIVYLFPGQGTGSRTSADILRQRFSEIDHLIASLNLPADPDDLATEVVQPRTVAASLAALAALDRIGVTASCAIGHSLGELTALHWAGAIDQTDLMRLVAARGQLMTKHSTEPGAMATLAANVDRGGELLANEPVVIACYNAEDVQVISGPAGAVERVVSAARRRGITAHRLPVPLAFHSPLLAAAADAFGAELAEQTFQPLQRAVVSTVTGALLSPEVDLRRLLSDQIVQPVRFGEALSAVVARAGLLVEVGPGTTLSKLAALQTSAPAVSLSTEAPTLRGFLDAAAAAFAIGHRIDHGLLFVDRFHRPLDLDRQPQFLRNPCEAAPDTEVISAPSSILDADVEAQPDGDPGAAVDILRQLITARAELPLESVAASHSLLDDLHLSSIVVGQIVIEACQRLGIPAPTVPTVYAGSTVAEVAESLEAARGTATVVAESTTTAGVAPWIRPFAVDLVASPLPVSPSLRSTSGEWHVFAPDDHPLTQPLAQALREIGGGVLLCADGTQADPDMLVRAVQAVLSHPKPTRLVVVGAAPAAAALAKTVHLEVPGVLTTLVDVPMLPQAVSWVVNEVAATTSFTEVSYTTEGVRRRPVLRALSWGDTTKPLPFDGTDVLLVSGGGKGITAECAIALARESGARLALLGRSDPSTDATLADNLARVAANGIQHCYVKADVTDPEAVARAIAAAQQKLGPITGVLHGAGFNEPHPIAALTADKIRATSAPKVDGLKAILAALDRGKIRHLLTFSSIIGRTGLPGEAAYAVANAELSALTQHVASQLGPSCRSLAIEWSVWAGVGMGERLEAVESLSRAGITPISVDEGVALLRELLAHSDTPPQLVVTGRCDNLSTVTVSTAELPLLRFLEHPRVHYPGVELVADADVDPTNDAYIDDHIFDGERLLPAVIGLEAIAQAATAVIGTTSPPRFEQLTLLRPVVVPPIGATTVRVAALVTGPDSVDVVVRSSETGFTVDHFRARCVFAAESRPPPITDQDGLGVPIEPDSELYGRLLFQSGPFRRVRSYRKLRATECAADIGPGEDGYHWFGPYLPPTLVLGDPGARDACLHAVQACVPDATLIPIAAKSISVYQQTCGPIVVHALERERVGDTFSYDLTVTDPEGVVVERWSDLRLQIVRRGPATGALPAALLGPLLERALNTITPASRLSIAVDPATARHKRDQRTCSTRAIQRALGRREPVLHRPDGRPEVVGSQFVSAAHAANLVLAVAASLPVTCDAEDVVSRAAETWSGLIGPEASTLASRMAATAGESTSTALTRLWTVHECLRKAGRWAVPLPTPIERRDDGWIVLHVGPAQVASNVVANSSGGETAVAVLVLEDQPA